MELATNTFGRGLQLDTNPMVQGTDTMTDCLNGTLLTMNGNEIILLNDMGNRRVNNAFLPSGYQPVGMKEYGGIIYVAAYNPITNKSLIGSFPSPLRKVEKPRDGGKGDEELLGYFDFSKFFKTKEESPEDYNVEIDSYLGIPVLKSDSFMIPLTGNTSLRAGDKFSIYSPNLYSYTEGNQTIEELVSNFYNVDEQTKKAYSPKNKKYTLSIGVLNSQNEFVDITKTLCRWDENSLVIDYDSSDSDIYKFNDGYFISKEFNREDLVEDIAETQLIKTRQKLAVNTYAYKLVGPLYMKALLNHIEKFEYSIDGEYDFEKGNITITGYLTYNCPDGSDNSKEGFNDNYKTFLEGIVGFNGFDLIDPTGKNNDNLSNPIVTYGTSTYDPNTNTYTVEIKKTYANIYPNEEGTSIFNYIIGVNADTDHDNLYIKGLSVKGALNFALLGSGIIRLTGWRFENKYNDELERNITYIQLLTESYPKRELAFKNLEVTFTNLNDESNTFIYSKESVLVRHDITLPWIKEEDSEEIMVGKYPIKENAIYRVNIAFKVYNNKGKIIEYDVENKNVTRIIKENDEVITEIGFIQGNIEKLEVSINNMMVTKSTKEENIITGKSCRWLVTSDIFNDFFPIEKEVFDYCDDDYSTEDFKNRMEILISPKYNYNIKTNKQVLEPTGNAFSYNQDSLVDLLQRCLTILECSNLTGEFYSEYFNEKGENILFTVPFNLAPKNMDIEFINVEYSMTNSEEINFIESGEIEYDLEHVDIIVPYNYPMRFSEDKKGFNVGIECNSLFKGIATQPVTLTNVFDTLTLEDFKYAEVTFQQDLHEISWQQLNEVPWAPPITPNGISFIGRYDNEHPSTSEAGHSIYLLKNLTFPSGLVFRGTGSNSSVEIRDIYRFSSLLNSYLPDDQICILTNTASDGRVRAWGFIKTIQTYSDNFSEYGLYGNDIYVWNCVGIVNPDYSPITKELVFNWFKEKISNRADIIYCKGSKNAYGVENSYKYNTDYTTTTFFKIKTNIIDYKFLSFSIGNLDFKYKVLPLYLQFNQDFSSSDKFMIYVNNILSKQFDKVWGTQINVPFSIFKAYDSRNSEIEHLYVNENHKILYSSPFTRVMYNLEEGGPETRTVNSYRSAGMFVTRYINPYFKEEEGSFCQYLNLNFETFKKYFKAQLLSP